jgi:hypothetical protein
MVNRSGSVRTVSIQLQDAVAARNGATPRSPTNMPAIWSKPTKNSVVSWFLKAEWVVDHYRNVDDTGTLDLWSKMVVDAQQTVAAR